jgi:hypothetical protein
MKSSKNTNSRRRLLAGGFFAGITTPFIPIKWTEPVVKAVLLPAHAQTSLECQTTDVIPGMTVVCDTDVEICTIYSYQFVDGCLVRTHRDCDTPPGDNELQVGARSSQGTMSVGIFASTNGFNEQQRCFEPFEPQDRDLELPLEIGGVQYLASFTLVRSQEPPSAFVSDITVAPA